LRQTAQEQAKAEKAFEVTMSCTNFVHKNNYTKKESFCNCFLEDFSALDTHPFGLAQGRFFAGTSLGFFNQHLWLRIRLIYLAEGGESV